MEEKEKQILIIVCLIVSIAFMVIPAVVYLFRRIFKRTDTTYRKTQTNPLFAISACLIGSIWCVRYALGTYGMLIKANDLTWWEEIFDSFVLTLKTFGIDDNYSKYISDGRAMIQYFAGDKSILPNWYSIYASLLNIFAPVVGGVVIFEILASIFPKIKLHFSHIFFTSTKYYFSELNSASLALARSVCEEKCNYFKKPTIIFTDAYYDDETEKSSELLLEAKLLGAICVRDDLSHVSKNRFGGRKFFLMDENGIGNLQTFVELANSSNSTYLKNSEIYLFTNDDAYVQVEQMLNEQFKEKFKHNEIYVKLVYWYRKIKALLKFQRDKDKARKNVIKAFKGSITLHKKSCYEKFKFLINEIKKYKKDPEKVKEYKALNEELTKESLPIIIPVNSYRNLISKLLTSVPLYEPIVGKEKEEDGKQSLNVTILGIGNIGIEMFLATYWLGQILDCKLNINIVSKEDEAEFWNKIDYINPEIRRTKDKNDSILNYNRNGDKTDVYYDFKYIKCDVKSSEFIKILGNEEDCDTENKRRVLATDYFFVSTGTDENNISVANTIRRYIEEYHINKVKVNTEKDKKPHNRVVITYVVYNSDLVNTLNQKKYFKYNGNEADIYMQATGSMNEVYDIKNVCMTEYNLSAQEVQDAYDAVQNRKVRADKHRKRLKDDYKYWASIAQAMHKTYRMYSMGLINKSIFDYADEEEKYKEDLKKVYDNYEDMISNKEKATKEKLTLLHRLAWLEHRRWNAFTRVKGFRSTNGYDVYANAGENGSYKHMDIKLHPCLLECDEKGIKSGLNEYGKVDKYTLFQCTDREAFDLLDDLSYDLRDKKYNDYDFKQYDYPEV